MSNFALCWFWLKLSWRSEILSFWWARRCVECSCFSVFKRKRAQTSIDPSTVREAHLKRLFYRRQSMIMRRLPCHFVTKKKHISQREVWCQKELFEHCEVPWRTDTKHACQKKQGGDNTLRRCARNASYSSELNASPCRNFAITHIPVPAVHKGLLYRRRATLAIARNSQEFPLWSHTTQRSAAASWASPPRDTHCLTFLQRLEFGCIFGLRWPFWMNAIFLHDIHDENALDSLSVHATDTWRAKSSCPIVNVTSRLEKLRRRQKVPKPGGTNRAVDTAADDLWTQPRPAAGSSRKRPHHVAAAMFCRGGLLCRCPLYRSSHPSRQILQQKLHIRLDKDRRNFRRGLCETSHDLGMSSLSCSNEVRSSRVDDDPRGRPMHSQNILRIRPIGSVHPSFASVLIQLSPEIRGFDSGQVVQMHLLVFRRKMKSATEICAWDYRVPLGTPLKVCRNGSYMSSPFPLSMISRWNEFPHVRMQVFFIRLRRFALRVKRTDWIRMSSPSFSISSTFFVLLLTTDLLRDDHLQLILVRAETRDVLLIDVNIWII